MAATSVVERVTPLLIVKSPAALLSRSASILTIPAPDVRFAPSVTPSYAFIVTAPPLEAMAPLVVIAPAAAFTNCIAPPALVRPETVTPSA